MNVAPSINFIAPSSHSSAGSGIALVQQLGVWSFGAFICLGFLLTVAHVVVARAMAGHLGEKVQLTQAIAVDTTKEGVLLALGTRLGMIDKITRMQASYGEVLSSVAGFVSPDQLETVAIDDDRTVSLVMILPSIDVAQEIVQSITLLAQEKKVRTPKLVSLTLMTEGSLRLAVSFIAEK